MSRVVFDPDIKEIFAPYVRPMLEVSIATNQGTFSLDLGNYESVCRMSNRIKIAIEGYDSDGNPTVGHPMPPSGPLEPEKIQAYNDWLAAGMPENADGSEYSGPIV